LLTLEDFELISVAALEYRQVEIHVLEVV